MSRGTKRTSCMRLLFASVGMLLIAQVSLAQFVVEPGIGVVGKIYLDDTTHMLRLRNTNETVRVVTTECYYSPSVLAEYEMRVDVSLPELGITATSGAKEKKLYSISIDLVDTSEVIGNPQFICNGVLFNAKASISRDQVIKIFGEVVPTDSRGIRELEKEGNDYAWSVQNGECIYYLSKGIMFDIRGGSVKRLVIMRKRTAKTD